MTMPTGFFVAALAASQTGEGFACATFGFACATFRDALRAPLPPAAAATPLSGRMDSAHASSAHAPERAGPAAPGLRVGVCLFARGGYEVKRLLLDGGRRVPRVEALRVREFDARAAQLAVRNLDFDLVERAVARRRERRERDDV